MAIKQVALVFTDIVGSTQLWEAHPEPMRRALAEHDRMLSELFTKSGGHVFKTVGDQLCVAFELPESAVTAALEAKQTVESHEWPPETPISIRIGLHYGQVEAVNGDYSGQALNRVARVLAAAAPGQIYATESVSATAESVAAYRYVGRRRMKGIGEPVALYRVEQRDGRVSSGPAADKPRVRYVGTRVDSGRPFVGRERELEHLSQMAFERDQRLISILGMGGLGKTRLACRFAHQNAARFRDGAVIVDCANLQSRDELVAALLAAADSDAGSYDATEELFRTCAGMQALFVCDCMEHLVEHADLLSNLVEQSPNLVIVATSRVFLAQPNEFAHELGTMSGGRTDGEDLFRQVATQTAASFRPAKSAKKVSALCELLDGVPLAITLAASRLRYMTLDEVTEQVRGDRFEALREQRSSGNKHESLMRVIEDSFRLLPEGHRRCLALAGVFRGGFTLDDANAVVAPHFDGNLRGSLAELRDHSLVQVRDDGGQTRYRVLDSVREFIERHGAVSDKLRDAHLLRFAEIADSIGRDERDGEWARANRRLFVDLSNMRQAWRRAMQLSNTECVATFARSLMRSLLEAGLNSDFRELCDATPAHCDIGLDLLRLGLDGEFQIRHGDRARARELWGERREMATRAEAWEARVESMLDLADMAITDGDHASADVTIGEARAHATERGQTWLVAMCDMAEAAMRRDLGDIERCVELANAALQRPIPSPQIRYRAYICSQAIQLAEAIGHDELSLMACAGMLDQDEAPTVQGLVRALLAVAKAADRKELADEAAFAYCCVSIGAERVSKRLRAHSRRAVAEFRTRRGDRVDRALQSVEAIGFDRAVRRVRTETLPKLQSTGRDC